MFIRSVSYPILCLKAQKGTNFRSRVSFEKGFWKRRIFTKKHARREMCGNKEKHKIACIHFIVELLRTS